MNKFEFIKQQTRDRKSAKQWESEKENIRPEAANIRKQGEEPQKQVLGANLAVKALQEEQLFEKPTCHIFSAKASTVLNNTETSKQTLNMASNL